MLNYFILAPSKFIDFCGVSQSTQVLQGHRMHANIFYFLNSPILVNGNHGPTDSGEIFLCSWASSHSSIILSFSAASKVTGQE